VIVLKAIAGELDMQDRHIGSVQTMPLFVQNAERGNYRLFEKLSTHSNTAVFAFNLNHKDPVKRAIFEDKRFRHALSLAIDREAIIDLVYLGVGEPRQPTPPSSSPF